MRRAVVITSAAYVSAEIAAEIGNLPPAFLPLHNRRLFEHQVAQFPRDAHDVYLTLPEGFVLDRVDAEKLAELAVTVVFVPTGLSLAESLLYAMTTTGLFAGPVRILHGDTLMRRLPVERDDIFSAGRTTAYYPWAEYQTDARGFATFKEGLWRPKESLVVAGYFSFGDAALLLRSLARSRGKFVRALNLYSETRGLAPELTADWYDFGHLQTYFASRARNTTERAFNRLHASDHVITKRSADSRKIAGEAEWFARLPGALRRFTPQLLASESDAEGHQYQLELLRLMPLSDLFVFGHLPQLVWSSIFDACDDWLSSCRGYPAPAASAAQAGELYLPKTLRRLESYARATGTDLDRELVFGERPVPGLRRIAELAAAAIPAIGAADLCVIHGDFCFSNVLYDHRASAIKVIDPRGGVDLHGDPRYDVAKLHHSVVGLYDFLLAGRYWLQTDGERRYALEFPVEAAHRDVQQLFCDRQFATTIAGSDRAIQATSVLLFLSMLPLHADSPSRQRAFIANALRLFLDLDRDRLADRAGAA
ncbi:MAG: phosphotransferase [Deltaproteobacteria bacterium]|nr:phosphotransferase [Deltaproteobacteria bacterium]